MPGAGLTSDRLKVFVPPTESAALFPINVSDPAYGAVGDLQIVTDGAINDTSTTLTSASALFKPTDVGKQIQVHNAGTGGNALKTTIAAYVSPTQVTLTAASSAGSNLSNVRVIWGTDDTAAINSALTAAGAITTAAAGSRAEVVFDARSYYVGRVTLSTDNITLRGAGARLVKFGDGPMFTVNATAVRFKDLWLDGNANRTDFPTYTGNIITASSYADMIVDSCELDNGDGLNGYCIQFTGVTFTQSVIRNSRFLLYGQPVKPCIGMPGTFSRLAVPTAPTATASLAAGLLGSGVYGYVVTFVNANGQTSQGAAGTTTTDGTHQQVALTAIPVGAAGTTARKVYRTTVGGSTYKLLTTIADNTTTTFTDNVADGSLGVTVPANNSTGLKENSSTTKILNNDFRGCDGVDFSGAVSVTFANNICRNCLWDDNTLVVRMVGCRLFGDPVVYGQSTIMIGNAFGGASLTLGLNANICVVDSNVYAFGSVTDSSGQTDASHRNHVRDRNTMFYKTGLRLGLASTDTVDSASSIEVKSKGSSTDVTKYYNSSNGNMLSIIREGSSNQGQLQLGNSSGTATVTVTANSGMAFGTAAADCSIIGVATATGVLKSSSTERFRWGSTGISFFAATEVAKQTVTGAKGGNAALGSLLTALVNYGLITDSSSA